MPVAREHIEVDSASLEQGYLNCRKSVKKYCRDVTWVFGNLASHHRRLLDPILQHGIRVAGLLDLESPNGLPLEVWQEVRDDVSDAFSDKYTSLELAALVDTARQHEIPQQLFLDSIVAADTWIRARHFQTYDELSGFASQIGGSLVAAAVPVLGFVKPGYETAAFEFGKSIMLTQLLANCVNDIKLNKQFIAQDDLDECEIVVHRLKLRQGGASLKNLVRLYCWRIDKSLTEGSKLISFLDYDARRSLTSVLSLHWKMLMQMKIEPDSLLDEDGVLSGRDKFKLHARHVLGMEGNVPLAGGDDHHH